MISRNPHVPDNIFELARHETVGDYARTYKDEIARRYEDLNLIYIPYFPLNFDLSFFQSISFPLPMKKVGTANGIDKALFYRENNAISLDNKHPLFAVFSEPAIVGYMQNQIAAVNAQICIALRTLFPRYYSLTQYNITWRLTDTEVQELHVDGFLGGKPMPEGTRGRYHRIKLFINIDTEPRVWWTSYPLPELLKRYRHQFPNGLPDDADMMTYQISGKPWLFAAPHHEIAYPTLSAVMGEAQGIPHGVRFGRRMIAAEFMCLADDMLDPRKSVQASLKRWCEDANIPLKTPSEFVAPAPMLTEAM